MLKPSCLFEAGTLQGQRQFRKVRFGSDLPGQESKRGRYGADLKMCLSMEDIPLSQKTEYEIRCTRLVLHNSILR